MGRITCLLSLLPIAVLYAIPLVCSKKNIKFKKREARIDGIRRGGRYGSKLVYLSPPLYPPFLFLFSIHLCSPNL